MLKKKGNHVVGIPEVVPPSDILIIWVSINRATPTMDGLSWKIPLINGWFGGTPIYGTPPYVPVIWPSSQHPPASPAEKSVTSFAGRPEADRLERSRSFSWGFVPKKNGTPETCWLRPCDSSAWIGESKDNGWAKCATPMFFKGQQCQNDACNMGWNTKSSSQLHPPPGQHGHVPCITELDVCRGWKTHMFHTVNEVKVHQTPSSGVLQAVVVPFTSFLEVNWIAMDSPQWVHFKQSVGNCISQGCFVASATTGSLELVFWVHRRNKREPISNTLGWTKLGRNPLARHGARNATCRNSHGKP